VIKSKVLLQWITFTSPLSCSGIYGTFYSGINTVIVIGKWVCTSNTTIFIEVY